MVTACHTPQKLLRRYLLPRRRSFAVMAACLLTGTGLQLLGPALVGSFVNGLTQGRPLEALLLTVLLYLVVTAAAQGAAVGATLWSEEVAWGATNDLRLDLVRHALSLDLSFHRSHQAGEVVERVDEDVTALGNLFSRMTVDLLGNGLLLVGAVAAMFLLNPGLGGAFALLAVLLLVLLDTLRRQSTPLFRASREEGAHVFGGLGEALGAAEDLVSSGGRPFAERRLGERLDSWAPKYVKAEIRGYAIWVVALAGFAVGDGLAYGLAGRLFLLHAAPVGTVYAAIAYAGLVARPLEQVRGHLDDLQRAGASLTRIGQLLDLTSSRRTGLQELPPGPLSLRLAGVGFSYGDEGEGEAALSDIDLDLPAGRRLAVLGRTGSGKSSLARLLVGLEDATRGSVEIAGVDVRAIDETSLRQRVHFVGQDVRIFDATLRENLTLFDDTVTEADLRSLLRRAGLLGWANRLGGLDASAGSGKLSAGEAQLIAVVRGLVGDPGLVVLDEPFSRLDPETGSLLAGALEVLLEGRTAVVIAHRTETLRLVDDVLVLAGGRVKERGTRNGLMEDPSSHLSVLLRSGEGEAFA